MSFHTQEVAWELKNYSVGSLCGKAKSVILLLYWLLKRHLSISEEKTTFGDKSHQKQDILFEAGVIRYWNILKPKGGDFLKGWK